MATARTLPIPAAHREFTVKVNGTPVPREQQLLSVSINASANRIAWARLCYLDGSASSSEFPLSNSELFVPGQPLEILAGTGDQSQLLFQGLVARHSMRIRDHGASQLIIECRHAATKLTVGRRGANYFDQSDSQVIEALFSAAGIEAEVEPTPEQHSQLVQFDSSDWDFLLSRAAANGKFVLTRGRQLTVKSPQLAGEPTCTLHYGATLLELDAEIDGRDQFATVAGLTWNPATQEVARVDAAEPTVTGPGNLSPGSLAEVAALERFELRHPALEPPEAQAWADATWLRSRLNKVSGRMKCEGIGTVQPGDLVELAGVGERFQGQVFVTGVRHEFDTVQGWKTHLQFGGLEDIGGQAKDHAAPAAGGLLPAVTGLQIGVVVNNEDPAGEHRVRIRLPLVNPDDDGVWARVANLDAGDNRGFCFRPEIGDEVVVGFLGADPRHPIVVGMLHSSAKPAPLAGSNDNHRKLYQSRSGMRLVFDDQKQELQLDTPSGNLLLFSDDQKSIVLKDQHGNSIALSSDGVRIDSVKTITLKSGTELGLSAGTSLAAAGTTELKLEGGASAQLTSSGITKVAGSMVHIN